MDSQAVLMHGTRDAGICLAESTGKADRLAVVTAVLPARVLWPRPAGSGTGARGGQAAANSSADEANGSSPQGRQAHIFCEEIYHDYSAAHNFL